MVRFSRAKYRSRQLHSTRSSVLYASEAYSLPAVSRTFCTQSSNTKNLRYRLAIGVFVSYSSHPIITMERDVPRFSCQDATELRVATISSGDACAATMTRPWKRRSVRSRPAVVLRNLQACRRREGELGAVAAA